MLTCTAIAEKMLEALRDSADILAKCQELFDKPPMIIKGGTGRLSPEDQDYPAFAILSWAKERGELAEDLDFHFTVGLALKDEIYRDDIDVNGVKTRIYQGEESVEQLLDLAAAEILAISSNFTFKDCATILESVEYFPLFMGALHLTISFPVLVGGYEPTL